MCLKHAFTCCAFLLPSFAVNAGVACNNFRKHFVCKTKRKQQKPTEIHNNKKNHTLTHTHTCECQASLFVVGVRQLTNGNLNIQKHVETLTLQQ